MMMTLGFFVFDLKTAPYQQLQRQTAWRLAAVQRVGARPLYQFIGSDEDTITLSGTLYPQITAGRITLDGLRQMANTGKGWPLIEGTGQFFGNWTITGVNETATHYLRDGSPQKIEFTLNLTRVDETDPSLLATGLNALAVGATGALAGKLNSVRDTVGSVASKFKLPL